MGAFFTAQMSDLTDYMDVSCVKLHNTLYLIFARSSIHELSRSIRGSSRFHNAMYADNILTNSGNNKKKQLI